MSPFFQPYEHHSQPVIPREEFVTRLTRSGVVALALILVSLLAGVVGYHTLERLSWLDAFLNAAMLLGGMGPVTVPQTAAGKLFAGCYALYCGLAVIAVAGILMAPVGHRLLHKFHASRGAS